MKNAALIILFGSTMISACSESSAVQDYEYNNDSQFHREYSENFEQRGWPRSQTDRHVMTVSNQDSGMVSSYQNVPANSNCNLNIPDQPTALCQSPNGTVYHRGTLGQSQQGFLDPDMLVNQLVQTARSQNHVKVSENRVYPQLAQLVANAESPILFKSGQRVNAVGVETHDTQTGEKAVIVFLVKHIPNNSAPITSVGTYAVSSRNPESNDFQSLHHELTGFVSSLRFDPRYVQALNGQRSQFVSNQTARNQAFQSNQNRIHQSNMDALDNSFNSYMERSNSSFRSYGGNSGSHEAYIDAMHERQQLIDPNTGQRYQADGYSDYNYINPNDSSMSVRSNDANWNPNINTNIGWDYNQLQEYNYRQ